jgi:hypothetical protein
MVRADEREGLCAEQVAAPKHVLGEAKDVLKELREGNVNLRRQAAIDRIVGAIPFLGAAVDGGRRAVARGAG